MARTLFGAASKAKPVAIEGRRIILPETGRVRLWMIADAPLWARLQEAGTLRVDPALVTMPAFLPHYDWVRKQMARRLASHNGGYPWWAWATPKPDLRSTSYHNDPPGCALVRLALEVPVAEVLCFDFYDWHVPLNDGYLSVDEAEFTAWESLPACEQTREVLEASWERLFDPDIPPDDWNRPVEGVQAVFETLRLADVTGVTHNRSRIARRDAPMRLPADEVGPSNLRTFEPSNHGT